MQSMQPNASRMQKCKKKCIKVNTGNFLSGKCMIYDNLLLYTHIFLLSSFCGSVLIEALV